MSLLRREESRELLPLPCPRIHAVLQWKPLTPAITWITPGPPTEMQTPGFPVR